MNVLIKPKKLSGDVIVPPSKSVSHRAIISASLAEGRSVIRNIMYSDDIIATIKAMRSCGAMIEEFEDYLIIQGGKVRRVDSVIDANESGSTMRFLIPISLLVDEEITFIGNNNLVNRPLDLYTEIFDKQGIKYEKGENSLPLKVFNGLKSGEYRLRGDVSSQFITGLLFALPLLDGDSVINLTTPLESIGYIDLTIDVLEKFGITIINNSFKQFIVKGNQKYTPQEFSVEGDFSQAAFFLAAGAMGDNINLLNMNRLTFQGDKKIVSDINLFNGNVRYENGILKSSPSKLSSAVIDLANTPDLGPILFVIASISEGITTFVNASRLRLKECDRIAAMNEELSKMGASIFELEDSVIIKGVTSLKASMDLDSHNDHRILMALSIASIMCDGEIKIRNSKCVNKSFPHFFEIFKSIGGEISYEE